jgi:hypothetical protein
VSISTLCDCVCETEVGTEGAGEDGVDEDEDEAAAEDADEPFEADADAAAWLEVVDAADEDEADPEPALDEAPALTEDVLATAELEASAKTVWTAPKEKRAEISAIFAINDLFLNIFLFNKI